MSPRTSRHIKAWTAQAILLVSIASLGGAALSLTLKSDELVRQSLERRASK